MSTDFRYRGLKTRPIRGMRMLYANGTKGPWSYTTGVYTNMGYSESITSKRGRKACRIKWVQPRRSALRWSAERTPLGRPVYIPLRGPLLPPNPLTLQTFTGVCSGGSFKPLVLPGYEYDGQCAAFMTDAPSAPAIPTDAVARASQALYAQASAPDFDGYLQLGEAIEAVQMLQRPLASLRQLSDKMYRVMKKRAKGKTGKPLHKAVAGTWLEYQLGIAPLVFQTGEIMSKLCNAISPSSPEYKYKQVNVSFGNKSESWSTTGGVNDRTYIHDTITQRFRSGGWLRSTSNRTPRLTQRLGLDGMRNLTAQSWRLMPLSFAVDWFVGVGPLLDECRPIVGSLINTWCSCKVKHTRTAARVKMGGASGGSIATFTRINHLRTTGLTPTGTLFLGKGLNTLGKALTAAALSTGITSSLWKNKPWH